MQPIRLCACATMTQSLPIIPADSTVFCVDCVKGSSAIFWCWCPTVAATKVKLYCKVISEKATKWNLQLLHSAKNTALICRVRRCRAAYVFVEPDLPGIQNSEPLLWEILCSTDRVTGSVYIVRVSLVLENQVFYIRTSRYNRLLPFTRSSWSTTRGRRLTGCYTPHRRNHE